MVNFVKKFYLIIFAIMIGVVGFFVLRKPDYVCIPVTFGLSSEVPIVQVKIGEQCIPLEIDLGSTAQASIPAATLKALPKKKYAGKHEWYDFRGNSYESPKFHISHMQIEGLHFKDVIAEEYSLEWHQNAQIWNEEGVIDEPVGHIGRPLLQKKNLFFDFPHSQIVVCNKLSSLIKAGFLSDNLTAVPFQITPAGVIVSFNTDLGTLRLILDTGASVTVIRPGKLGHHSSEIDGKSQLPMYISSKFSTNSCDFGPQRMFLLDITLKFSPADGFLGVDFIRAHPMYLDFQTNTVYIDLKNTRPT